MPTTEEHLLHPEIFDATPILGPHLRDDLAARAGVVAMAVGTDPAQREDPNVSIVIRTRNDDGRIQPLIEDIRKQEFGGERQIIVVDTESIDGTAQAAKSLGASVVTIAQAEFTYPNALNLGFRAADHPYVLSLVGHSKLSNDQTLHGISRWCVDPEFGGVYGVPLVDTNASQTERLAFGISELSLLKNAVQITKSKTGVMGANAAAFAKVAWEEFGGFDEAFGAGGEDTELARRILAAHGTIVREPVLSVHHSHGLGPVNLLRQAMHWLQVVRGAHSFDPKQLAARRPDLNL